MKTKSDPAKRKSPKTAKAVAPAQPLQLYQSSKARSIWGQVSKKALNGEAVAILFGDRAFLLKEVQLTYAEQEYGVSPEQLDVKSEKIRNRALEEIRAGKARKIA
ncbi:MAG: hypothetical protein QM680_12550 [Luteolibacter sp.]